jgi:hypothetical protein
VFFQRLNNGAKSVTFATFPLLSASANKTEKHYDLTNKLNMYKF